MKRQNGLLSMEKDPSRTVLLLGFTIPQVKTMELVSKTIGECLKERARLSGRRAAIEMEGFHCTFEQLDRSSDFAAARMEKDGIGRGTHAGIWCTNSPDWVLAFLALTKIGAVPVLINTCFRDAEVTRVLNDADVEVLYHGAGKESVIERIRRNTAGVRKFIPIGETGAGTWARGLVGTVPPSPADLKRVEEKENAVKPETPACMIFTSGTTSFSKGVLLSHYSLVNNSRAMVEAMRWKEDDKMCLTVPLFHCFGVTAGILACLLSGAEMDLLPCFKTAQVWDELEQGRCTILNGVPSMFLALIRKPEHCGRRAGTLRSGIIAGSPVTPEEYAEICRRFPQMHLQPSYGQTETSPCVTIAGWNDSVEEKGRSAGRTISHVEARVADLQTGGVLGCGRDGEIQVRGYNVMLGYYRLPEVTAEAFTEDGWLRTGDIGNFDASGELHVTGRLKEMIIRGGENISPREIERAVQGLQWVDQIRVVGVPAEVLQEELAACVVPKPGCGVDREALVDFLKPRLARYKIPAYVLKFDAFPLNACGKVSLEDLKAKAAAMVDEEKRVRKEGGRGKMNFR